MADVNYQQYAKDIAEEIVFRDIGPDDDECRVYDLAHEYADGSEHVIYYYKAHQFLEWLDARTIEYIEGEIFCVLPQQSAESGTAIRGAFFQ